MNQSKFAKIGKAAAISAIFPVAVYLLFTVLCALLQKTGFNTWANMQIILRTAIYNGFIAWAFSYNMLNGRFDFSIGSVMVLSTIIGADLAVKLGCGPIGMLILFVVAGVVLGAISGILYVLLKVPSMVCSIGVTMVYEALTFTLTGGNGVIMIGKNDLLVYATGPYIYVLCAIGLAVVVFLSRCTIFGYNFNALGMGQSVCVSVGIKEKSHAIKCYMLAGGLMACAGIINFSILGTCQPKTGLSSSSYMMSAFLPMFVGSAIGRYSDRNLGILIGALIQAVITSGFTQMGLSSTLQSVLNAVIVLGFLFVETNSYKIGQKRMFEEKRCAALAEIQN
ncbi:MAG: hypothetical protein IJY10_07820 [Lachnospiraceae bacterium]|nr:hypothetical protein [Lachnospiraceae bacterium]MBQ9123380.1 hypothetical protein [Lachnospiraceae bacterium]